MTEQRRGCGYRKIGGTYLVGGKLSAPCGRLPMPLHICPTCSQGIKQTRGWTWVKPAQLFANLPVCTQATVGGPFRPSGCATCPLADVSRLADEKGRCGLLWVGETFYPTPEAFSLEASALGVCRRIAHPPRGAEVGKTWILLAHPKAVYVKREDLTDEEVVELKLNGHPYVMRPGVFSAFKLSAIERCVTEEEFKDEPAMEALRKRGLTPVALPDIPRHRGSAYEKEEEPELPFENS